jgi:hypothetical protein
MLVDKCQADRACLAGLLKFKGLDGRMLVRRAVEMNLVDEDRLARLISQFWELPFVDVSFPYRRFLVHFARPVDDLLQHDLLPLEIEPGELTVVSYYVPSPDTVRAVETARSARLKLYIAALRPVQEALLRLAEEVKRFRDAKPVDCGSDKELFYKVTADGWPALVRERVVSGGVLIEFDPFGHAQGRPEPCRTGDRSGRITKTVESLDPLEPPAVAALLLGKSMSAVAATPDDIRRLTHDFVETVGFFDGELAEAILKLRVAQMMFDSDEKE